MLKIAPSPQSDVFYNEKWLMQREESLVSILKKANPLIPEYNSFFTVDGRDAFLQSWVDGRLWFDEIEQLSEPQNQRLWQQLGAFTKTLHSIEGKSFGYPPPFDEHCTWSEFIFANVEGMVEDCKRLNVMTPEITEYCQLLPKFADNLDKVSVPNFLHGDIWPRNVLFDGHGEDIHITAVIDAERAFWGDPISDWVLLFFDLPESFWTGYGENLRETSDPLNMDIYKGMYYIQNVLECVRFDSPDSEFIENLKEVNQVFRNHLAIADK